MAAFIAGQEKLIAGTYESLAIYFESHPDYEWTGARVAMEIRRLLDYTNEAKLIERGFDDE